MSEIDHTPLKLIKTTFTENTPLILNSFKMCNSHLNATNTLISSFYCSWGSDVWIPEVPKLLGFYFICHPDVLRKKIKKKLIFVDVFKVICHLLIFFFWLLDYLFFETTSQTK